jgi:hypothetical protein
MMSGTTTVLQIYQDNLQIVFHATSNIQYSTPLGRQLRARETVLSTNRSVYGLSVDCERWRHCQEAANIAIHRESLSSKITFPYMYTPTPMGSTMLAIPRSDCGEDWPPGSFRRGSAFSVSTLECKSAAKPESSIPIPLSLIVCPPFTPENIPRLGMHTRHHTLEACSEIGRRDVLFELLYAPLTAMGIRLKQLN